MDDKFPDEGQCEDFSAGKRDTDSLWEYAEGGIRATLLE